VDPAFLAISALPGPIEMRPIMNERPPNVAADIVSEARQLWLEVSRRLALAACAQEAVTTARLGNATLAQAVAEHLAALKRLDRGAAETWLESLARQRASSSNVLASTERLRVSILAARAAKDASLVAKRNLRSSLTTLRDHVLQEVAQGTPLAAFEDALRMLLSKSPGATVLSQRLTDALVCRGVSLYDFIDEEFRRLDDAEKALRKEIEQDPDPDAEETYCACTSEYGRRLYHFVFRGKTTLDEFLRMEHVGFFDAYENWRAMSDADMEERIWETLVEKAKRLGNASQQPGTMPLLKDEQASETRRELPNAPKEIDVASEATAAECRAETPAGFGWYTQQQVADYVGVTVRTVRNWISGRTGRLVIQQEVGNHYLLSHAELTNKREAQAAKKARTRKQSKTSH
jgi:hypothetical protein